MKEITNSKDSWGENVIYVRKCTNYKYEDPEKPTIPIFMFTDFENEE